MEHVLIAQDTLHIEHFLRQSDKRWILYETDRIEDTIELASIGCTLSLADVLRQSTPVAHRRKRGVNGR